MGRIDQKINYRSAFTTLSNLYDEVFCKKVNGSEGFTVETAKMKFKRLRHKF